MARKRPAQARRRLAVCITLLVLTAPASAMSWDDAPDDWDAQILHAIEDSETWGMVLSQIDAWTADEMWGLVDTVSIPPVSQATRAAIRDRLAVDNRMPDNRFRHMPVDSEGWLIHLIVDVVITIVLVVVGYIAAYLVSSTAAATSTTATITMDDFWELVRAAA